MSSALAGIFYHSFASGRLSRPTATACTSRPACAALSSTAASSDAGTEFESSKPENMSGVFGVFFRSMTWAVQVVPPFSRSSTRLAWRLGPPAKGGAHPGIALSLQGAGSAARYHLLGKKISRGSWVS